MLALCYYVCCYSYKNQKQFHCSVGSAPVIVQCRPHHCSPRALILCLSAEDVNFLCTPLLDVIQLFSARSSSPRFFFRRSRHPLLRQPVVLHPAYTGFVQLVLQPP